jgi:predicted O-linked N-acetylglucosamine transferase (SPINDLY family)
MAASILTSAMPKSDEGAKAAKELIATGEEDYESKAVALGNGLIYRLDKPGKGKGRLVELRKLIFEGRWEAPLFDTRRWVRDLEQAYELAWGKWVSGEGGDIWL